MKIYEQKTNKKAQFATAMRNITENTVIEHCDILTIYCYGRQSNT